MSKVATGFACCSQNWSLVFHKDHSLTKFSVPQVRNPICEWCWQQQVLKRVWHSIKMSWFGAWFLDLESVAWQETPRCVNRVRITALYSSTIWNCKILNTSTGPITLNRKTCVQSFYTTGDKVAGFWRKSSSKIAWTRAKTQQTHYAKQRCTHSETNLWLSSSKHFWANTQLPCFLWFSRPPTFLILRVIKWQQLFFHINGKSLQLKFGMINTRRQINLLFWAKTFHQTSPWVDSSTH